MAESAIQIAAKAAQGFQRLECEECARSIRKALLKAGHHGRTVEIRAANTRDFITCRSFEKGKTAITQNGRHLGVQIADQIFDNLHPNGVAYDSWLVDFDAPNGVVVHRIEDF